MTDLYIYIDGIMQVHACMDKSADRPHDQPSITANKWYQQFKKKKKTHAYVSHIHGSDVTKKGIRHLDPTTTWPLSSGTFHLGHGYV
jgi:hypothetical protein